MQPQMTAMPAPANSLLLDRKGMPSGSATSATTVCRGHSSPGHLLAGLLNSYMEPYAGIFCPQPADATDRRGCR